MDKGSSSQQEKEVPEPELSPVQRNLFAMTNAMICLAWVGVFVIVVYQWLIVDGGWQGIPSQMQGPIQGVVLYTTVVQVMMNYNLDRHACGQELIRCACMFGVIVKFPEVQASAAYGLVLLLWSVSHLVDQAYCVRDLLGSPRPWLTTIYNSWFRLLSPLCVGLEVYLTYCAMPLARQLNKHYALIMILTALAYVPAFPFIYQNRLISRKNHRKNLFLRKN
ncbi:hypothetical protein DM01DRAFT_1334182, partial [Hesseltinella vesiculosa]